MSSPSWALRCLHFVLPLFCLGCEAPILEWRSGLNLCRPCRGRLRRVPPGCSRCGLPLEACAAPPEGYRCPECRRRRPPFDAVLAAWLYRPPLDRVVQGLKYRRLEYLGRPLAAILAERFRDPLGEHDLVVPVPLHWRRRWQRGYNQAAAISRPLARRLALPHGEPLRRRRATPPQARLRREERVRNLRRAFAPRRRVRVDGLAVLLVDDVVTTGATFREAAAVLQGGGARRVTCVAVARSLGRAPGAAEARIFPPPYL